ncbi:MAG TPA: bifunctional protein-serine/threonine kinase/phosphatase [Rhodocyclaceae bacterium]|nr:bifunctional protein-serine/threonine kinase/phosphatase [Rhodocyclaceae bacterium]
MPLDISLGYSSLTGPRPRNEDYYGFVVPEGADLENKGMLAAVADGVGGHANGREASEFTVRGLLSDYYATPDTWAIPKALDMVLQALNRWLYSQAQKQKQNVGMATTLTALVLRGSRYTYAHVGDSRLYRLRDGELTKLTNDHVWDHPELDNVLSRAVGLDATVAIDYGEGELKTGDIFMLCSDGVWNRLGDKRILDLLSGQSDPQEAATRLASIAEDTGSQDNCTAVVLHVKDVPTERLRDSIARAQALPLPPLLKIGEEIDGLVVDEVLHESRLTLLYRVHIASSGQSCVLKTLRENADPADIAAMAHEEWLARRVTDAAFPQVLPWPQHTHLYYLMSWHEGASLGAWLKQGRRWSPPEVEDLGIRLLKGLSALHRLDIVHRDIKPDNVHLGSDGRLRILDLGVAASDGQDFNEINNPGTPSYMAPELYAGADATIASDLYACGVTLYELLTRKYPYGEIEPFQKPKFGDPTPPTRYRPDIPEWLEAVLLKAVARDVKERFETAEEFLLALERGAHRPLRVARKTPLLKRDPNLGLKLFAGISAVLNLILLYLFMLR